MDTYAHKVIITFFVVTILVGSMLLSLPGAAKVNISFIDKFFTATSAVCVTGLTVVDISKTFSFLGQLIILLLIQIGGLGYMLLGSTMLILFGKISIVQKSVIGESLNIKEFTKISDIVPLLKKILLLTFIFEFIGALVLFFKFLLVDKFMVWKSIWYAVFHSISAFCNAGFSLFSNSFETYKSDVVINLIIPFLIISGGLGFFVWIDILSKIKNKKEGFSLHTKIVLLTTFILIFLSAVVLFVLNRQIYISKGLSLKTQIFVSWFQAVTPRTAGFNTFTIKELSTVSILIIIYLMFIGASPGGTGGGVKTSTFAVIVISVYRYLTGEKNVALFKRQIKTNTVLKSFTIFFVCLSLVLLISILLCLTNDTFSYKEILFETVSAFGTVGLSLGITPYIDNLGKILLIITMLIGRVGSITLFSLLLSKEPKEIKYLEEQIAIG